MTEGQTFHCTTDIGIKVRQTGRLRFISPSTSDYVLFHPHVVVLDRQTDKLRSISLIHSTVQSKRDRLGSRFISPFMLESTQHKQRDNLRYISSFILESTPDRPTFHFTPHIVVLDRQTDKLCFVSLSYWDQSMTDGWTFITSHIVIYVIETDERTTLRFTLMLGSKKDRQTNLFSSLILESTSDRQTKKIRFIHFSYLNPRQTEGQTTFHFIPHIGIQVRQTDGQTQMHFTPQNAIHVRQTDKLIFISPLILESK